MKKIFIFSIISLFSQTYTMNQQNKEYIYCPNPYSKKHQNLPQQTIYDKVRYTCEYCHNLFDHLCTLYKHQEAMSYCKYCTQLVQLCILGLHENYCEHNPNLGKFPNS